MQRYDFFAKTGTKRGVWFVKKSSYLCHLFLTKIDETKLHKIRLCVS